MSHCLFFAPIISLFSISSVGLCYCNGEAWTLLKTDGTERSEDLKMGIEQVQEIRNLQSQSNPEGLGSELLETLVKMAPTKEEEIKLKDYNGDISKLGTAERFLKGILDIPFAFKRFEAMLYRANFDTEVKYLRNSFETLEIASEELKNSRLFLKLLEAVLQTGYVMNVGTNRGAAKFLRIHEQLNYPRSPPHVSTNWILECSENLVLLIGCYFQKIERFGS